MSTPQDQYRDLVQQSQQAIQNAVDTWTKTVQDTVTALPSNPTQVDPGQVVDQVFDFAERMLEMQRDFTKNLLQNSAAIAQSVARQTGQAAQSAQPGTPTAGV
jgi:hypothetical protein